MGIGTPERQHRLELYCKLPNGVLLIDSSDELNPNLWVIGHTESVRKDEVTFNTKSHLR